MLKHRLLFGPPMLALVLGLLGLDAWLGPVDLTGTLWAQGGGFLPPGLIILGLLLVVGLLCSRELAGIVRAGGGAAHGGVLGLAAGLGLVLCYILPHPALSARTAVGIGGSAMAGVFMLALIVHSVPRRQTRGALSAAASALSAGVYLGVMPGFFLIIRHEHAAWLLAAILLVTKACDIGAYFTGRALGRHKLIPWLSPGKTWEGLAGGLALSALVATGLAAWANAAGAFGYWNVEDLDPVWVRETLPLWYAAMGGLILGGVGVVGDLVASLLKRDAGVKDSGNTIPGYGGILDVVDSPLLVAPAAYALLTLMP